VRDVRGAHDLIVGGDHRTDGGRYQVSPGCRGAVWTSRVGA
jgi:hypothetical protein